MCHLIIYTYRKYRSGDFKFHLRNLNMLQVNPTESGPTTLYRVALSLQTTKGSYQLIKTLFDSTKM